jgi:hypothetical protein
MLEIIGRCPKPRLLCLLGLGLIVFLDTVSTWITSNISLGCFVAKMHDECPSLHTFAITNVHVLVEQIFLEINLFSIAKTLLLIAIIWECSILLCAKHQPNQNQKRDNETSVSEGQYKGTHENQYNKQCSFSTCGPFTWFYYLDPVAKFTLLLFAIGIFQWHTFEKTDITLRAAQRPWIAIDFIEIASDLMFWPPPTNNPQINLKFQIRNTGNPPAIKIHQIALITDMHVPNDISADQSKACENIQKLNAGFAFELTLFPNQSIQYTRSSGIDGKILSTKIQDRHNILPIIVGCIDYQSTFDNERHATAIIRELSRIDLSRPGMLLPIDMDGMAIPKEQLRLSIGFTGTGPAN